MRHARNRRGEYPVNHCKQVVCGVNIGEDLSLLQFGDVAERVNWLDLACRQAKGSAMSTPVGWRLGLHGRVLPVRCCDAAVVWTVAPSNG
ncbi:MAG: hypothetical protein ACJAYX_001278 [Planctomycetota bacterium]|jgi:hypothetical protein